MQAHRIEAKGVEMRWLEHGEGAPVVLLHGLPTSPTLWRKVMPLVPGARLLAWEMVGYGHSIDEGWRRDLSLRRQVEYLRQWMQAIGLPKALLVGHDLGGGLAHLLALRHPESCAGLVLTNCVGYDAWPIPAVRFLRALGPVAAHFPDALLKATLGLLMLRGHDDLSVAQESLNLHFEPYAHGRGADALVHQIQALHTEDTLQVQDQVPRLRGLPACVVWGAADRFLKLAYGERFAHDLGCQLVKIENGKHFVPEDHPGEVAAAIARVLVH